MDATMNQNPPVPKYPGLKAVGHVSRRRTTRTPGLDSSVSRNSTARLIVPRNEVTWLDLDGEATVTHSSKPEGASTLSETVLEFSTSAEVPHPSLHALVYCDTDGNWFCTGWHPLFFGTLTSETASSTPGGERVTTRYKHSSPLRPMAVVWH